MGPTALAAERGLTVKLGSFGEITLDRSGALAPWALYVILRYGRDIDGTHIPARGFVVKPVSGRLRSERLAHGFVFFGLYFRTYCKVIAR